MSYSVWIILAGVWFTSPGSVVQKDRAVLFDTPYATLSECRSHLKDPNVYAAGSERLRKWIGDSTQTGELRRQFLAYRCFDSNGTPAVVIAAEHQDR